MSPSRVRVWPGLPWPLGATWDGTGTNFALFSAHAERVELCLFDETGERETDRVALPEYTDEIWHGYLPDVRPGQLYGYRVAGPYDPATGHRFNHHKLLLDPYAKAIEGRVRWNDAHHGFVVGDPGEDLSFDERDSAPYMPRCRVVDPAFTWGAERPTPRAWHETVIFETHVRGHTMRHPEVPAELRGTFAGLSTEAVIDHLVDLGVTAVELLPVHAHVDERRLAELGLVNYWGYNPIGFFAPEPSYLSGPQLGEFKTFVRRMHDAGLEVILDVVYNHTAEGNHLGPTLSFRGIDNKSYYALRLGEERYYEDYTGCGNALELRHPRVLQMVTDSLRYWVDEMRVDGFRFDLATTLARVFGPYDDHAGFLDAVAQDPVLSTVKLIAEPWDTGPGGYQLGNFPPGWSEWNDRYRDTMRRFWRGEPGQLPEVASRLAGSSDLFDRHGRRPWATINFVTAHDGFTLHDLVAYERKHNEANGEHNRDGHDDNHSLNFGVEGPTDDPTVLERRRRQMRNLTATLLLSQGVPMLLAGDERARTQGGNNNAYCQDNETSWIDWEDDDHGMLAFTRRVLRLRHEHIVFHRRRFFRGLPIAGTDIKDVTWLRPDGKEIGDSDWRDAAARAFGMLISGEPGEAHLTQRGEPEPDDTFLLLLNASPETTTFRVPANGEDWWEVVVDTASETGTDTGERIAAGATREMPGRTLLLLVARGVKRAG